ncbi:MAG: TonB-dependent receptor [Steroidobacteraceae bacterium]
MQTGIALVLAIAVMSGSPVLAQSPAGSPPRSGADRADVLEEVVVTARRREENLQDVPASISVIGSDLLEASDTVNTQQLSLLVPSLYYNSANPRNTAYTIRGLGSNTLSISAANDGIEPGVGFYVDQVYHGRPATAAFDFTDIDHVEVLRGPQGTLFGKNTTGGAIHILSRAPSFEPEANAEVSFGQDSLLQVKGSLSGPVAEVAAARLSAQLTRRDGLIRNVRTGKDLNALDNYALRGQLLFEPRADLSLRLIADVTNLDAACCTQSYLRFGQSRRSAARQYPALAAGLGYSPPSPDVYDRLTDIDADLRIDTQDGGVSLLADWKREAGTLTSVTAWRYWDWDVANDRDYTGIPIQSIQRIPSRQDQYSQEFRFASSGDGALRYVAGLYFFQQEIQGKPTSVYGAQAAYWLLNPANFTVPLPRNLLEGYGQIGNSRFRMQSYAAFGESSYSLTPRLTATLGLRYTYEHKEGSYATQVSGGPDLSTLAPSVAAELRRAQLTIFRPQSYTAQDDGGSLSGRANLAFAMTDELMAYASYAYGYKSGGLNMSGLPLDAQNQPALATAVIEDETHRAYEVGVKSTLFAGRATFNLAAYRTTVENYQANIVSSLETAAIRSYPSNIPEVRVQGVEADLATRPFEGLMLRASVAYADGKNVDYAQGPCPLEVQTAATMACDLTGARLAGLSRWATTLGADYRRSLGSGATFVHFDSSWRSGYFSDTSASQYTWIEGYNVTNASLGYQFERGWEVSVFARNLFDTEYLTALTIQTGNSGLILGQPGDPRIVGVSLRTQF